MILAALVTSALLASQANSDYREGEIAHTIVQQEEAYNKALQLYLQLEGPDSPPSLYDMIGNSFYQLGSYGWAILYYQRALELEPRNPLWRQHLQLAEGKLGIPHLAPHRWLSHLESLQLLLTSFIALWIALSALIWWPKQRLMKRCCIAVALVTLLSLTQVLYQQYVAPLKAVMVRSSILNEAAGVPPVLEGSTVDVLHVSDQGRSLSIKTVEGHTGYVSYSVIRII